MQFPPGVVLVVTTLVRISGFNEGGCVAFGWGGVPLPLTIAHSRGSFPPPGFKSNLAEVVDWEGVTSISMTNPRVNPGSVDFGLHGRQWGGVIEGSISQAAVLAQNSTAKRTQSY